MLAMGYSISKVWWVVALLWLVAGCAGQPEKPVFHVAESGRTAPGEFCDPQQGVSSIYRKKVAVLATDLRYPQDATDLPDFARIWSELLQQRLGERGHLLIVNGGDQRLYTGDRQQEWIVAQAKRLGVQFVMAVRFHNLHTSRDQFGVGSYAIPLRKLRRQIEAEVMIFEGLYGTQIASVMHSIELEGRESEVLNLARSPLLRGTLLDNALGGALRAVLSAEVESSLRTLACLLLEARVTSVVGDRFYIDTSGAALVRAGDTLQLFRLSGQTERHLGAVEILKVFPQSVVGIYKGEGGAPVFSDGLRVRER